MTINAESNLIVVPFNMLPAEKESPPDPGRVLEQKKLIFENIVGHDISELVRDDKTVKLLRQLGSDPAINAFACNFRIGGKDNQDIVEANYLNGRIFNRLSISRVHDVVEDCPLILTSSSFLQRKYGECLYNFKRRLGLNGPQDLFVLVNVTMSPWPTPGRFLDQIANEFRKIAEEEVQNSLIRNLVTPDRHGFIMQGIDRVYLVHLPIFHMANHRYQLIITGILPQNVREGYVKAREADPSQIFSLANASKQTLAELIVEGSSFEAVINKGYHREGDGHFIEKFSISNIRVVINESLESKALDGSYPAKMPFYLYGTGSQVHIDHVLRASPNIQINSDCVKLTFPHIHPGEKVPLGEKELECGMVAVLETVGERFLQPLISLLLASIFAPGTHHVTIYPNFKPPQTPGVLLLTSVTLEVGLTVFHDSQNINKDPIPETAGKPDVGKGAMNAESWAKEWENTKTRITNEGPGDLFHELLSDLSLS